ncbi:MAG: hypothetical protein M1814_002936 [Vezdaea aestivalis]|nr:MAG: hypothetical protein M1814_002936 [Vezdaea aestivalis]
MTLPGNKGGVRPQNNLSSPQIAQATGLKPVFNLTGEKASRANGDSCAKRQKVVHQSTPIVISKPEPPLRAAERLAPRTAPVGLRKPIRPSLGNNSEFDSIERYANPTRRKPQTKPRASSESISPINTPNSPTGTGSDISFRTVQGGRVVTDSNSQATRNNQPARSPSAEYKSTMNRSLPHHDHGGGVLGTTYRQVFQPKVIVPQPSKTKSKKRPGSQSPMKSTLTLPPLSSYSSETINKPPPSVVTLDRSDEEDDSQGAPQISSNIRSTDFKPKRRRPFEDLKYQLKLIRTHNFEVTDILLVQDLKNQVFRPELQDVQGIERFRNLLIEPTRLNSILWHSFCPEYVQLEFPRVNDRTDNKVDLKFARPSNGSAFLRTLQEWTNQTLKEKHPHAANHMEKCFAKRKQDMACFSDILGSGSPFQEHLPEDIALLQSNSLKKRKRNAASETHQIPQTVRPQDLASEDKFEKYFVTPGHIKLAPTPPRPRFPSSSALPESSVRQTRQTRQTRNRTNVQDLHEMEPSSPPPRIKFSQEHGLGNPWKSPLVYPPTGRDRATVDFSDIERLDEDEWLNDNLIMFYVRYLERNVKRDSDYKIHIFNTFFYKQLSETTGPKKNGQINYDKVQKWTKVDIFDQDFLVVPVCSNSHWWMVIICNLQNLTRTISDGPEDLKPQPIVAQAPELTAFEKSSPNPNPKANGFSVLSSEVDIVLPSTNRLSQLSIRSESSTEGVKANDLVTTGPSDDSLPATNPSTGFASVSGVSESEQSDIFPATRSARIKPRTSPRSAPTSNRRASFGKSSFKPATNKRAKLGDPVLISLDSLGITRGSDLNLLKHFILAEGDSKRGITIDKDLLKGMKAVQVPQQTTFSDCGVFLLAYLEKFLQNPRDFTNKLIERKMDEEADWEGLDINDMRAEIRKTIFAVHDEQIGPSKTAKQTLNKQAPPSTLAERNYNKPPPAEQLKSALLPSAPCSAPKESKSSSYFPVLVASTQSSIPDQENIIEQSALPSPDAIEEVPITGNSSPPRKVVLQSPAPSPFLSAVHVEPIPTDSRPISLSPTAQHQETEMLQSEAEQHDSIIVNSSPEDEIHYPSKGNSHAETNHVWSDFGRPLSVAKNALLSPFRPATPPAEEVIRGKTPIMVDDEPPSPTVRRSPRTNGQMSKFFGAV